MDSTRRVEGKYCDWGWEKAGEGKVHFSAVDWFDHCKPLYTWAPFSFSFSLTHTHTLHRCVTGKTRGTETRPSEEKLKCSLLARETWWKQHLSKSVVFLSVSLPFFPTWILTPVLFSIRHSVSLASHLFFWLSLSLSACYSWHIVLFPRWWLIWETSHSALHIWNPFTRERDLWYPLLGCLGLSQIPDQIPVEDTSLSLGVQVPPRLSGWTGTAHKQTGSQIQAPVF